jgi:transposase-like protein
MQQLFSTNYVESSFGALAGISCPAMDTNLALRQQAARLVFDFGVTQKAIAYRMGIDTSTFSRWLRGKTERAIDTHALDGFRRFLSDLRDEVTLDVTSMTKDELERIEAVHATTTAADKISRNVKKSAKKKAAKKGKKIAQR